MANSNKKGANKAQGKKQMSSLKDLVKNADTQSTPKTIIPSDGRHIVYLSKISILTEKKDGTKLSSPLIRFFLGIAGTSRTQFNAVKFLNADFESDPKTYEGANTFLEALVGAVIKPEWAEANDKLDFKVSYKNAVQVVEFLEMCRTLKATRSFVVQTVTEVVKTPKGDLANTRIVRVEARKPKADPKAPQADNTGNEPENESTESDYV